MPHKDAQDTSDKWFSLKSAEFSVVGECSTHHSVRNSDVVKVGQLEYLPVSVRAPEVPSKSHDTRSPGIRKQSKS